MAQSEVLDEELIAGLKLAKSKRCGFALVAKGSNDGALVISKHKVPPVLITLAKKKCGGTSVIEGAVLFENGAFVFETPSPAATLPNALKLIAKRDAGMTIVAVCRDGTGNVSGPAPTEQKSPTDGKTGAHGSDTKTKTTAPGDEKTSSSKPVQPDDAAKLAAAYHARVTALTEDLKKAIATQTPAGDEAKAKFSEARTLGDKKDFAKATAVLKVVEDEIKKALAGKSAGGSEHPQSATNRLNNLKPAIKDAMGAGGPNVARIHTLLTAATGLLNDNDSTQANKVLDELEPLLVPAEKSSATDSRADGLRERIKVVQTQAATLPDPMKSELRDLTNKALAGVGKTDDAKFAAVVEVLENKLAIATRAARIVQAAVESGDRVNFHRLQFEWEEAQDRARENLAQFGAKVLANKEIQASKRFKDVEAAVSGLGQQMPDFGDELDSALGEIADAEDDTTRAAAKSAAQKVIANYSAELDGFDGLRKLQALSDEEFGGAPFFSELQQALGSLKKQLEKAA